MKKNIKNLFIFQILYSIMILVLDLCQPGGMVDAIDSKSIIRNGVWVQVPWLVPNIN